MPVPRAPRPDDLYALRVPTELRLSPDGRWVAFVVKAAAPAKDGYRHSVWMVPSDASAPARQVTLGVKNDTLPRWSPDGTTLAFLSDRGAVFEAGGATPRDPHAKDAQRPHADEDDTRSGAQVWLLPVEGGEARQLTELPYGVSDVAWSPDGSRLCVVSAATAPVTTEPRRRPEDPPRPDARIIDRLQYQLNGVGFIHHRPENLWLVDVADASVRRLTRGRSRDVGPRWSPDGRTLAFVSDRHPDADLTWRTDIYLVDVDGNGVRRLTGGRGDRVFTSPAWSRDGASVAAIGHRYPAGGASRAGVWTFAADQGEVEGEDLTATTDLMADALINSDLSGGADPQLHWSADGRRIAFAAPVEGSYEAWQVDIGTRSVQRLTQGEHSLSRLHAIQVDGGLRVAAVRATGTEPPDVVAFDVPADRASDAPPVEFRRLTNLVGDAWADIEPVAPVTRWHEVDGRRIQGWFLQAERADGKAAPLVVEIHGGPATLYGWSPFWEWQCLAAAGMSVYACNPRGSTGYGEDFAHANFGDWGDGPMRDVMAGVDALISEGLADPERLGVTGGSYGGYLTTWIVGHTDRFRAAVTCRSVSDMTSQMLSGDLGGPTFGKFEYGANPWEDPELYRRHSPLTYAPRITTPLLIQHSEKDLRTPMTQAEELFSVLRSLRRPVRLMRVPDESHELTRSGAPFRRVENIERIRDWFRHFLVDGRSGMPPA